jgi:hypothetical protein
MIVGMRVRREKVPPRPRLDYHDPTAGIGGSAPAASALTLRLALAIAALAGCVAAIALTAAVSGPVWLIVVLAVVAASAVADLVVIVRRKRGGEAG